MYFAARCEVGNLVTTLYVQNTAGAVECRGTSLRYRISESMLKSTILRSTNSGCRKRRKGLGRQILIAPTEAPTASEFRIVMGKLGVYCGLGTAKKYSRRESTKKPFQKKEHGDVTRTRRIYSCVASPRMRHDITAGGTLGMQCWRLHGARGWKGLDVRNW